MSSKNTSKNSGQRARPSLPNGWGPPPVRAPESSARPRLPNMWGPQPAPAPEASVRPRLPNMWGPPPVRAPLAPLRADPRLAPLIIQPPPLVSAPPVRAPLAPLRADPRLAPLIIEPPPLPAATPMRSSTPARRAHRAVAESRRANQVRHMAVSNNGPPVRVALPPPPAVQRSTTPRPSSASRSGRPPPAPPAQTRKRVRNGLPPLHPGPPILVPGPGRSGFTTRKANPNTKVVNGIALKKRNGL